MKSLTPNVSQFSESLVCRKISAPGSLFSYISLALEKLTKEWNWEEFGDATPEESAQFFMNIIDEFAQSECGEAGGGMQSIGTVTFNLITSVTQTSGQTYLIEHEDLPEAAAAATALLIEIQLNFEGSGVLVVRDDMNARQEKSYYAQNDRFQIVAPMNSGIVRISMAQDDPPETHSIIVNLLGWW